MTSRCNFPEHTAGRQLGPMGVAEREAPGLYLQEDQDNPALRRNGFDERRFFRTGRTG